MRLRNLDISRLMDAYEDREFMPKEEVFVDKERIKADVMRRVKGKRRTARRAALVAAALCACLALAGWAWGDRIYQFLSGGQVVISGSAAMGSGTVTLSEEGGSHIISLEEGRLWFVAGGQRTDITGQVDQDTPYVWTEELEDGSLHYIVVGGTPEDYGWWEGVKFPDGSGGGSGILHSCAGLSQEEQLKHPAWYGAGMEQVQALWDQRG